MDENVRIDWDSKTSFNNWVGQIDLTCVRKEKIGLLGTVVFLGWTLASYFVPQYSDVHGRKVVFITLLSCQSIVVLGLIFSKSWLLSVFLLFLFGLTIVGALPIGYIYVLELMTQKNSKVIGPLIQTTIGLCLIFGTFLLQFISKNT